MIAQFQPVHIRPWKSDQPSRAIGDLRDHGTTMTRATGCLKVRTCSLVSLAGLDIFDQPITRRPWRDMNLARYEPDEATRRRFTVHRLRVWVVSRCTLSHCRIVSVLSFETVEQRTVVLAFRALIVRRFRQCKAPAFVQPIESPPHPQAVAPRDFRGSPCRVKIVLSFRSFVVPQLCISRVRRPPYPACS